MASKSNLKGEFANIKKRCEDLASEYAARNTMCDELEAMYLMDWTEGKPEEASHVKLTISPEARNKALGAIRLLTAADPKFSVPTDKNNPEEEEKASAVEKAANAIWYASGRIRQNPIHYDLVTSAVLFGEMQIGITATADIVDHAKGGSKAALKRAEQIAAATPYVFEVFDPRTGYPEFDEYGLASFYRKSTIKSGKVLDDWGDTALLAGMNAGNRFEDVDLCEYWDNAIHAVWIDGKGEPLYIGENIFPCIPIVAQITDGSSLHEAEEFRRQPFLYSLWKSKLWNRLNLSMTAMYTNIFAIASNPTFIEKVQSEDRDPKTDFSVPGGKKRMLVGEDFYPLAKNAIDPGLITGMQEAQKQLEETTIYGATLGEPLGGNAPYSMVALLNQAGRLPLTSIQRRGSWAIGHAMELAFLMMKDKGGTFKTKGATSNSVMKIAAADIPEDLIIEAQLDIKLPQDKQQLLTMAMSAVQGDHPFMSYERSRREYAGIEQSDEEDKIIIAEQAAWVENMMDNQKRIQEMQMKSQEEAQARQMQAQQQMQPQQGMPQQAPQMQEQALMEQQGMQPGGAGIPPEVIQQLQQRQAATSGSPMTQPLPVQGMGGEM